MTAKEYYKSTRMVETRNWTLEMALNFAEEYAEALHQPPVENSLPDSTPHTCPECSWLCDCTTQPCSCCLGNEL